MVPLLSVGHYSPVVPGDLTASFFALTPNRVLDAVEVGGLRSTGRCLPLRAFENRVYAVGAARPAPHRPRMSVERYVHEPLEVLMAGDFIPGSLAPRYRDVAMRIADAIAKPLAAAPAQRIHGDLHRSNVLWTSDGPVLVDFDDFITGPPAQDLWLLAPGNTEEARRARWEIVEGYEVFRELDRSTLELCEPLRALRIIYMSAWIARRWDDASFRSGFPAFGTDGYWAAEYEALFNIFESLSGQASPFTSGGG